MKTFTPSSFFITTLLTAFTTLVFAQTPSSEGQWSPVLNMGIVPVAAANLPDGRLITWASKFPETYTEVGDGMTYTAIFDPSLGTHGQALPFTQTNTNHDMFCPGINNLPDGRILVAGGTSSERTTIYDPVTEQWTRAADMNVNRGYQGNTTLSDGSVFTVGGSWSESTLVNGNKNGELYTPETGWISLPGILGDELYNTNDATTELQGVYRLDNHVWLWENSNGTLFHLGPGERMHRIDLSGSGDMVDVGQRGDDTFAIKGTTVMYDVNKVFKVGGARSYNSGNPGKDNSFSIDISGATPVVTQTANMAFERTMHNSTVLPNGQILVTGGIDHAETFSDTGSVLGPELYDPATDTWTTLVDMATPRTYHSVAILLTDGRVFVGGGGLCDQTPGCVNHQDAEIFSPPYLFDGSNNLATRPIITNAPDVVDYNQTINITTDTNVTDFSLIRFSAVTHSTNNEQRRIPVTTSGGTSHSLTIPQRELLPPGYYMLFAMDANGVPSVAKTMKIGNAVPLANNPNLVLELGFDETSGAIAGDTSGNNNNATIFDSANDGSTLTPNGTYWTTDGLFGGAIEFDGGEFNSNSIVDIPTSSSMLSINNTVTVMAWVNRSDIVDNAGLFTHLYPNLFFGFHNSLFKWEFDTDNGQQASCYAGYTPLDTWVHIAATYDGTTARLFANGVEICTKNVTGDFVLNTTGNNRETAFTASGFYQTTNNTGNTPGYNSSGVIDELTGKLDEMKVFDKALGAEEIKMFFEIGKPLDPTVPDCAEGVIVAQYKVGNGDWITANNANVPDGSEVYIRAITTGNEQYFITKPKADGNTYDSTNFPDPADPTSYQIDTDLRYGNASDGLVAKTDEGQYVFTTASGCATVLNLNVAGSCDPGDAQVSAEWKIGAAAYQSGNPLEDVSITAEEGQAVRLSIIPNQVNGVNLSFTVTAPNGSKFENIVGDYIIQNISPTQAGAYLLESSEGCSVIIDITVNPLDCSSLETEYEINSNGTYITGATNAAVDQGNSLLLSIIPNGVAFSIAGPNGNNKAMNTADLTLNSLTLADAGTYTFTSSNGCIVTLELTVEAPDCSLVNTEYEINGDGNYIVGQNTLSTNEGATLLLSITPNGTPFSITGPNGNNKSLNGADLTLNNLGIADAGTYTFTTSAGCIVTLELTVNVLDCSPVQTEYEANGDGNYITGASSVNIVEGGNLILSLVPNGNPYSYSIDGPNNNNKAYNLLDLTLNNISTADAGIYTFNVSPSCQVTLEVIVDPIDCSVVETEYEINGSGNFIIGSSAVTVAEGDFLELSIQPNGTPYSFSIDGPNGNTKVLNLNDLTISNISQADAGTYTFTTGAGCIVTLDVSVDVADCTLVQTEYEINGDGNYITGESVVSIEEGNTIILSIIPNGQPYSFSIAGPNSNSKPLNFLDLTISNITESDEGLYSFTTGAGCEFSLNIIVNPVGCNSAGLQTSYSINSVTAVTAQSQVTITEGDNLDLDILPSGTAFSVSGPNGNDKPLNTDILNIVDAQSADAGTYTFTTTEGCTVQLVVTVQAFDCSTAGLQTSYSINGATAVTAQSQVTITEGDDLELDILPSGTAFSVSGPNGNDKPLDTDILNIVDAQSADAGTYTFTTTEGCTIQLVVAVQAFDCSMAGLQTSYSVNGAAAVTAQSQVTIMEGDDLDLNILPSGTAFTVSGPNGNDKPLDTDILNIVDAQSADAGTYTFTTTEGCTVQLVVAVQAFDCSTAALQTSYSVNGTAAVTAQSQVTITEGDDLDLNILPSGTAFTVSGPNGNDKPLNTDILNIMDAQTVDAGTYTFTTTEGCTIQLVVAVQPFDCSTAALQTSYSINGATAVAGQAQVTITEGDVIDLAILPIGTAFSVTGPNGNDKPLNTDILNIMDVQTVDAGTYTFTTTEGCTIQLVVAVQPFDCSTAALQTSYSINGATAVAGQAQVTITEGDAIDLAILPIGTAFSVTGPNGNDKPLNTDILNIMDVQTVDAGTYTFTTTEGCNVQLVVDVQPFDCNSFSYELQYSLNESSDFISAPSATILEGETIIIIFTPDTVNFSVSGPNKNLKPLNTNSFTVAAAVLDDQGIYIFTTSNGCSYNFDLTVTPNETLSNPSLDQISVYPNPVTEGTLFIELDEFMNQALTANLFDVYGKLVISKEISINHGQEESLNISTLSEGLYILEISLKSTDEAILKKVIKLN